jgi:hypothetical protein
MKKRTKLIIYLALMTALITGSLYVAGSERSVCPVCNHAIASEVSIETINMATIQ